MGGDLSVSGDIPQCHQHQARDAHELDKAISSEDTIPCKMVDYKIGLRRRTELYEMSLSCYGLSTLAA